MKKKTCLRPSASGPPPPAGSTRRSRSAPATSSLACCFANWKQIGKETKQTVSATAVQSAYQSALQHWRRDINSASYKIVKAPVPHQAPCPNEPGALVEKERRPLLPATAEHAVAPWACPRRARSPPHLPAVRKRIQPRPGARNRAEPANRRLRLRTLRLRSSMRWCVDPSLKPSIRI